jgi:alpha-glucosidase
MEPGFMELLGSIPAGWDTTIIIDAKVGNYIITARKKNNDWYIAGMCDSAARDVAIEFSFLDDKNYIATICKDGINANRNALDYKMETITVKRNDFISVHLAPNGGFLIRLIKQR